MNVFRSRSITPVNEQLCCLVKENEHNPTKNSSQDVESILLAVEYFFEHSSLGSTLILAAMLAHLNNP